MAGSAGNAVGFTLLATVFFTAMYLVAMGPVVRGLVEIELLRGG